MKPIDMIPGFAPVRTVRKVGDSYEVHTRPPAIVGGKGKTILLNEGQYRRFCDWRDGSVLIQNALPELTNAEREALMTGL